MMTVASTPPQCGVRNGECGIPSVLWSMVYGLWTLSVFLFPTTALAHYGPGDCNDGYGMCFNITTGLYEWFDARDPCKGGSASGDPVDTFSGAFVHTATDLRIPGRGLDVEIRRTYRNKGQVNGAFGYNWSFNYHIQAKKLSSGHYLITGDEGHELVYRAEGQNGLGEDTFCGCEFFSRLVEHADGTLTLFKKDGTKFEFNANGALSALKDRFGNTLRFEYAQDGGVDVKLPILGKTKYFLTQPSGIVARDYQLVKILDTYDRELQLTYYTAGDGLRQGRLKQVIDYTGRTVTYDYDDDGNLTSVTSPATADFPNGKTTRYTYAVGQANEALNHNLLSIIDPKQQEYLVNVYDGNDRVISQAYGGGTTTWSYNDAAMTRTVTDGNGNVTEHTFDSSGQPIREKRFTRGLRPGEPPFFETTYENDANSERTKTILPKGNVIKSTYSTDGFGNLLEERRKPNNIDPDSPNDIVVSYTYEPIYNQVRTTTDPRGFVTTHLFDYQEANDTAGLAATLGLAESDIITRLSNAGIPMNLGDVNGDGVTNQLNGKVIKTQYPTATVEGQPQTIEAFFVYNDVGQALEQRDPEGHRTTFDYHPANDPDGDGTPVPGQTDTTPTGYLKEITRGAGTVDDTTTSFVYDALGNVASTTDGKGFTTTFEHNALNQLTRIVAPAPLLYEVRTFYDENDNVDAVEVQNTDQNNVVDPLNPWFTTTYAYDTWNRRLSESSEVDAATTVTTQYTYDANGNLTQLTQPAGNLLKLEYDERNLLFRSRRGFGAPEESVTTFNYDLNGNRAEFLDGNSHATTYAYDLFNRVTTISNVLGHYAQIAYDPAGNVLSITQRNSLNVKVAELLNVFDELNRLSQQDRSLLDGAGAIADTVTTRFVYDKNSRLTTLTDDNAHSVAREYDALDRLVEVRDHLGNATTYTYDDNHNIQTHTVTDLDDQTPASQLITTTYAYDALNRLISLTDQLGRTATMAYDSRSNPVAATDRQGNTVTRVYDGLSRLTQAIQDLRDASGAVVDTITTASAYDAGSRLTDLTDDNGHVTHYTYDVLNRLRRKTFAFGTAEATFEEYTYDDADNLLTRLDQNGVTTTYDYDDLNRLESKTAGAITESYQYDALSRLTQTLFQDGPTIQSTVSFTYDSLNRLLTETQNSLTATSQYDGVGNRTQLTYPGAGFFLTNTHTAVNALDLVKDPLNVVLADYNYLGPTRSTKRTHLNGMKRERSYDALGRVSTHQHRTAANTLIKGFGYGYDKVGNRLFEEQLYNAGVGDAYRYDSVYRLTKGWFSASSADIQAIKNAITNDLPIPEPASFASSTAYTLDGLGNRTSVDRNGTPEPYVPNLFNEYDSVNSVPQVYDNNGNLLDDGTRLYTWDYENRLADVRNKSDNSLIVTYRYDALNRRITKVFPNDTEIRYIYDGGRILEERDETNALLAKYVYGRGIDEVLLMKRAGQDYSYHENSLGSIVAVTDAAGNLVEQYEYDHYGVVTIRDASGTVLSSSAISNPWLFTGRQYDPETGLYYYRNRYYSPATGRFLSRDPIGYVDGLNLYQYVQDNPMNWVDPLGFEREAAFEEFNEELSALLNDNPELRDRVLNALNDGEDPTALIDEAVQGSGSSEQEEQGWLGQAVEQAIKGEFYEGESTVLGTVAEIGVGIIPIADARDIAASGAGLWNDPSWGAAGVLCLNCIGAVPLVGDAIKGAAKGGRRLAKAGRAGARLADEALDAASAGRRLQRARRAGESICRRPHHIRSSSRRALEKRLGPRPAGYDIGHLYPNKEISDFVQGIYRQDPRTRARTLELLGYSPERYGGAEGALRKYYLDVYNNPRNLIYELSGPNQTRRALPDPGHWGVPEGYNPYR